MAPELAAAYVVGWIPSLALSGVHLYLQNKKYQSAKYQRLQRNLQKVNLAWSETNSALRPWASEMLAQDRKSSEKTILIMGTFSLFLSWVGFFFHLIILLSIQTLAVSRLETAIFSSRLALDDLSSEAVQTELTHLRDRGLIGI